MRIIINENQYRLINEVKVKADERVKIYDDGNILVVAPLTHTASCKYGSNTPWCVAVPGTEKYFKDYMKGGTLICVIIRDAKKGEERFPGEYKFAYYQSTEDDDEEYSGLNGWYDMSNNQFDSPLDTSKKANNKLLRFLIPPEVFSAMSRYISHGKYERLKIIKDKMRDMCQSFLNDPDNKPLVLGDREWYVGYRTKNFTKNYIDHFKLPEMISDNSLLIIYLNKMTYEVYQQELSFYRDIKCVLKNPNEPTYGIYKMGGLSKIPEMHSVLIKYWEQISNEYYKQRKMRYDGKEILVYPQYIQIGDEIMLNGIPSKVVNIYRKLPIYYLDIYYVDDIVKKAPYNAASPTTIRYNKEKHNPITPI